LFGPDIFEELYVPTLKKVNDFIHENTHCKTLYHSCGSIRRIIGHMIDAGVDCLNPVQTNTANMDPRELKAEFGDRLTFWGAGVETQTVYTYGTPEEVERQVKERLEIFAPGGGFVFSPIHNTQNNVPFDNIKAMRDTVLKYRAY
jgi:uroporphyrinogen decarboxylase